MQTCCSDVLYDPPIWMLAMKLFRSVCALLFKYNSVSTQYRPQEM